MDDNSSCVQVRIGAKARFIEVADDNVDIKVQCGDGGRFVAPCSVRFARCEWSEQEGKDAQRAGVLWLSNWEFV